MLDNGEKNGKKRIGTRKNKKGNINVKESIISRDVDVLGIFGFPMTVAADPIEADRANYNFPIKTSVEKTPFSTSTRESLSCKRDRSSIVESMLAARQIEIYHEHIFVNDIVI